MAVLARPSKLLHWTVALGTAALFVVLSASCTGQGEGERCQLANGNDDCQSGLICYAANTITIPGTTSQSNADICCLPNRVASTEDICKLSASTPQSDAAINDSSATTDTGTGDASSDTGSGDATSSDGASDASDASDGSSDATGQ